MAAYVRFGLPCAAVWVVYLLAFWPGILTEDSIEQWTDMTSGVIRGYHSPLQTILHSLLTRLWLSPAIIVLAQIAALSAAYTMVAAECAARNAPRWLLAATTLLVAALPANGFIVVTLWKDVPYSIALLMITALTLRLARSGGRFRAASTWWPWPSHSPRRRRSATTDCPRWRSSCCCSSGRYRCRDAPRGRSPR